MRKWDFLRNRTKRPTRARPGRRWSSGRRSSTAATSVRRATSTRARAMTDPGSRAATTSPAGTVRSGSVMGTARMPCGTPKTCNQVCGTTLAHRPVRTWAKSAATESVSTRGRAAHLPGANGSSRTRRPRNASVSRHSGNRVTSARVADSPRARLSARANRGRRRSPPPSRPPRNSAPTPCWSGSSRGADARGRANAHAVGPDTTVEGSTVTFTCFMIGWSLWVL